MNSAVDARSSAQGESTGDRDVATSARFESGLFDQGDDSLTIRDLERALAAAALLLDLAFGLERLDEFGSVRLRFLDQLVHVLRHRDRLIENRLSVD